MEPICSQLVRYMDSVRWRSLAKYPISEIEMSPELKSFLLKEENRHLTLFALKDSRPINNRESMI